jgi:hypothetical protein
LNPLLPKVLVVMQGAAGGLKKKNFDRLGTCAPEIGQVNSQREQGSLRRPLRGLGEPNQHFSRSVL